MALTFTKKAAAGAAAEQTEAKPVVQPPTLKPAANVNVPSWMKTGAAAKQAFAQEETKAEERKAEAGKLWRFYVAPDKDAQITFLDGSIGEDGLLEVPVFYEHRVRINGEWENFVCTADKDESQPCPLCSPRSGARRAIRCGVRESLYGAPG